LKRFNRLLGASLLLQGCYLSHGIDAGDPGGTPGCPPESSEEHALIIEVLADREIEVRAGTRSARVHAYRVSNVSEGDIQVAEWPQLFAAVMGEFHTTDGERVFTNIRLIEESRTTRLGPEYIHESATGPQEILLWDALLLRARRSFTFTLVMDIATGASGIYEITSGDGCHLTPRAWFAHEDGPEVEMPIELIANNRPLTTRVTIVPSE
jgi:hypothetical protein